MIRIAAVALALTTICASPALAQHPSAKAAPDSLTNALVGTWEDNIRRTMDPADSG